MRFFFAKLLFCLQVQQNWNEITNFDNPIYHTTIGESTNFVLTKIEELKNGKTEELHVQAKVSATKDVFQYDFKEAILYALSLHFNTNEHLKYLYENHPEFCVFPSFGVIPAQESLFNSLSDLEIPHGINIDPTRLLHGEHYLELFKPLPTNAKLTRRYKLADVMDKGSGASLIFNGILLFIIF